MPFAHRPFPTRLHGRHRWALLAVATYPLLVFALRWALPPRPDVTRRERDLMWITAIAPDGRSVLGDDWYRVRSRPSTRYTLRDAETWAERLRLVGEAPTFSRDGRLLIATSRQPGSSPDGATIWDTATGRLLLGIDGVVFAVAEEGRAVAIQGRGSVRVVDLASGRVRAEVRSEGPMALTPDGRTLAYLAYDEEEARAAIVLLDVSSGRVRARIGHPGHLTPGSLVFSDDGKYLASWVPDGTDLEVRDAATGRLVGGPIRREQTGPPWFDPDRERLLPFGSPPPPAEGTVWDLAVPPPPGPEVGEGLADEVSNGRCSLLLRSRPRERNSDADYRSGGRLVVYDWKEHREVAAVPSEGFTEAALSPDGRVLAVSVRIDGWHWTTRLPAWIQGHLPRSLRPRAYRTVREVRLYRLDSGREFARLPLPDDRVHAVGLHVTPDNARLLVQHIDYPEGSDLAGADDDENFAIVLESYELRRLAFRPDCLAFAALALMPIVLVGSLLDSRRRRRHARAATSAAPP